MTERRWLCWLQKETALRAASVHRGTERHPGDYDFATGEAGEPFDCDNPVNESPHNTGLTELPSVEAPEVWYSFGPSEEFPGLGTGGIGPMGGPAYDADAVRRRFHPVVAWPEYYDGKPLFYEWTRDYIKAFTVEGGEVVDIEPVIDSIATDNPMDLEFGPNGALYMLEYGDGFFSENPEAELSRIDYIGPNGNHAPEVEVAAEPTVGGAPLTVQFTSDVSDADGDRLRYAWDFDGDGKVDAREENPTHTYTEDGVYLAHLSVTDQGGRNPARSDRTTWRSWSATKLLSWSSSHRPTATRSRSETPWRSRSR